MVFQTYALYPHMTVAQNLGFGLRMRGIPKARMQRQIHETAQLLGIDQLLARRPRELSGGQRQRVAMGRALVRRPRLFLLDEPLSNLDAQLRVKVRLELKVLHRRIKSTIIYVTHDQVEAMTLGDRVVVMREGSVHQVDRPENIYARPSDTFVATFIGSPEMNLFKGKLARAGGRFVFQGRDFSMDPGNLPFRLEGNEVEVGIRPEDIKVGRVQEQAQMARVEMISDVGSDKYIHASIGETTFSIRAPKNSPFQHGETIPVVMPPSNLHVFHHGRRVN
jgi:ABC-type sugar transport system ATPase subunit